MFSRPPQDMRSHPIGDMIALMVEKLIEFAPDNKIHPKVFEEDPVKLTE